MSDADLVRPIAITPAAAAGSAPARAESPAFRGLLESLERLARGSAPPPPIDDTDSLARAVADADAGFRQAMDLRRALEDAFRQQRP